ncbi:MAG: TolC family protein [Bryobacteraceae bacterium]|nr:TolC family protein [Bryobacteraceae bacterium]
MRSLVVFLVSALVVPAQQAPVTPAAPAQPAPVQPGTPAPQQQPVPSTTAQPPVGAGAEARMNFAVHDASAPWVGSPAWMRRVFSPGDTRVTIQPPVRLKDFVIDGKLVLSLKNYLDLVLANNTDIAIQRLSIEVPKNAIQRAFSIFDPTITSNFNATRSSQPAINQLQGAQVVSQLNQPLNTRFQQLLPTSTTVFTQLNWSKLSTNDQFALYNPAYTTTWQMGFTQPLWRGRGPYITKIGITIARATRRQQDFNVRDAIMRLLVTAEQAYWDVVSARENLKVNLEALKLAEAALERTNREIELGATSELERFQPEQNAATARINVTRTEYQLRAFEDALRRQIGADLDPDVRDLPIVLTEDVSKMPEPVTYDREKLVQLALENRPDIKAQKLALDINDLQIQNALNSIKPVFNLTGSYQTFGRGGPGFQRVGGTPIFIPGTAWDAWSMMFGFNYNTYSFGFQLQLPLRDRAGAANLADAVVNKRLAALRERSLEQQIRQEVLNAITNVESSREGVRLAQIAVDYAQKRVEADQKRYDLGVINIFFLLSAQNDLATAQSNLVNQTVNYRRNLLILQQRLGTLLEDRGIVID